MRKARRKRKSSNTNQAFDIIGIVLLFLGPITLISLLAPDTSGVVGHSIKAALTNSVGVGSYVFPFLSALIGVMFIIGPITVWSRNAGIGGILVFLVIIGWAGLTGLHTVSVEESGGIIGWLIATGLESSVGVVIGRIILALAAIIGLYIAVDVPIANLIAGLRNAFSAGADATRDRLTTNGQPRKNGSKPAIRMANAEIQQEDEPKQRRRLLPILVRKGEPEADAAPVKPDERKIPVSVGHIPRRPGAKTPVEEEPEGEQGEYRLPPLTILNDPPLPPKRVEAELRENVEVIERTLEEFKVSGDVVEIAHGPTLTRYEIRLAPGIKVSKIVSLADNLAMSLAAIAVRVEAPIPGKSAIGVEVPNKNSGIVSLREVLDSNDWRSWESKLAFALGKDVAGDIRLADLSKMPHMLIGGATNSGKSICLNALIASLLFRCTPDEMKMILIDPKRVELSLFDGIPHLACPVVRNVRQAAGIFRAATKEMDNRYELIARSGSRNIQSYNEKMPEGERLPYLVIVCDELADLMMQAAAEVETSICRLAQLARAVGIHLVIATQRPSVDVITGLIKANISSRIAFAVSSQVDSRTIIDMVGAERLIGRGDMLYLPIDAQKPMRVQGCYVAEEEIHRLVEYLKTQRKPTYTIQATDLVGGRPGGEGDGGMTDELYEQAVRMIVISGYASTSMIQRKFKIGYTRAARLVDAMEQQGIVGPLDGAKPREVLVNKQDLDKLFGAPLGPSYDEVDEDEEEPEDE